MKFNPYFMTVEMDNFFDEVDLQEFKYIPEKMVFLYPCPCGDEFVITLEQLENGEEIAQCPSCSLIVRVIFDEEEIQKYQQ